MELMGTWYVVATIGNERLLMAESDVLPEFNDRGMAVLWQPDRGYSDAKDLQVWLKWLTYIDPCEPPYLWTDMKSPTKV